MRVYQTMVRDDRGNQIICPTIEHEGELWLVPKWLELPTEESPKPERLIRVRGVPFRPAAGNVDYVLDCAIPTSVLFAHEPPPPGSDIILLFRPSIESGRR